LAVVSNGKIEWARSYGMADVSQGREMTNETLQLAASISKPISAVRAHQLVEEGVFDLDADINSYLTSWKVPENEFTSAEKVTIRRILNHTAGLTVWGFPGYDKGDTIPSVVAVLDGKGNTDPVKVYKVPGESWMYSGGGYTVLQLAMMDTEGMAFHQSMQENVLNLMNMEGSTFENPLPEKYHNMAATGYRHNGDEVEGKWPIYPEMAAAGLWTTPSMLIQYAIEIQRIYQSGEDGILKYETVKEMLVPGMNGHGLGPGVSEHTFGHGGADEGFRSRLVAWKDQPYAIVVMVNSDNGSIIDEVLISFADEYGLPGFKPAVKEVVERTEDELQKYTGKFLLDELGEVELYIEDGQLMAAGEFMDELAIFLAENDTLFFDKEDWQPIDFDLENGRVDGFNAGRFRAERVK
jgi:CubicO group peptidase (beta-lactamase class C family)